MFDDLLPISDFIIPNEEVKAVEAKTEGETWSSGNPQDLFSSGQPQDLWTTK